MGKRARTAPRRPPAGGPAKSKRTDELAAMSDSDDDEIVACKGTEGSLPSFSEEYVCGFCGSCWLMRALFLFVSGFCFAVHKKRDMIPLNADDGQHSSFHATEISFCFIHLPAVS